MMNLYWKTNGETRNVVEAPFQNEEELERYIFDNPDLLGGDIHLLHRQVRTGNKRGIPDILGVDRDQRICIIELKNTLADESILPQALGYALWAEANPDSIKALQLESRHWPEEIELDWDNLDIRIILIAPAFKPMVPRMAGKIGYEIDLIQIHRYVHNEHEFLLVETLAQEQSVKVTTTKAKGNWNWEYYASEHGAEATDQFRNTVERLEVLAQQKGWDVRYNLNKSYAGFKLGNRIVFAVVWGGVHTWKVEIKVPEQSVQGFAGKQWEYQSYDDGFGNAIFRPVVLDWPDFAELETLLAEAYSRIAGN